MKREALGAGESGLNADILFPLVDDMLANRQECLDEVNKMFGTNITVEFDEGIDHSLSLQLEAAQVEATQAQAEIMTNNAEASTKGGVGGAMNTPNYTKGGGKNE